jgi:hypothetical protein
LARDNISFVEMFLFLPLGSFFTRSFQTRISLSSGNDDFWDSLRLFSSFFGGDMTNKKEE